MIFLSAADTKAVFDWSTAISCIRNAYSTRIASAAIPGRVIAADRGASLRCMPALPPLGRYTGTKQISRTQDGKVTYVITLFDKETGSLSHLLDGISTTAWRTAAASAVALDALSPSGPIDLAVLGSGLEAHTHVEAVAAVRDIRSLTVFSPTRANCERFVAEVRKSGVIDATPATSAEFAVKDATHVIAAARSRDESPILYGPWLAAGAVVISIGSTTPSQRELDVSVVERASVIVSDVPDELSNDTGDMIAARNAGIRFESKLFSLQDLMQNRVAIDRQSDGVLLFKSVGSALQDICFAEHIVDSAAASGIGTVLDAAFKIKQSIGRNA